MGTQWQSQLPLAKRAYDMETVSGAGYTGEQVEGGRGHGCDTEAVHNKRVKSMKRNLTREIRRADDSLTALQHLKTEIQKNQGEILALQNELQLSMGLKEMMDRS